jgi:hypothetical protein
MIAQQKSSLNLRHKLERAGNHLQGVGCGAEIAMVDPVVRKLCCGQSVS